MHVELVGTDGLQGGQHDREVLGQAAGHHGIHGHLLHRALDEGRGHDRHHLVGRPSRSVQHAGHPGFGRGNNG